MTKNVFSMRWWWGSLNTLSWIVIVLAHWDNTPWVDMSFHPDTLFWFRADQSLLFLQSALNWADRGSNSRSTTLKVSRIINTPPMGWWWPSKLSFRSWFFQNIIFFNYDSLTTCSLVSCNESYHSSLCLYVFMIEFRTALIMWYFVVFHFSA